jgi:hypothetical protein
MTEKSGIAIRDLLPETFERMTDVMQKGFSDGAAGGEASIPNFAKHMAGSKATAALRTSLNGDLFETLAHAWSFARELHEYTDATKHPPDEQSVVFLGEHDAAYTQPLVLSLSTAGLSILTLRFVLELTAHFQSAALAICAGRITGLAAGQCRVSAQLKYKDIPLHARKDSQTLKLPGHVEFKPGVQIG